MLKLVPIPHMVMRSILVFVNVSFLMVDGFVNKVEAIIISCSATVVTQVVYVTEFMRDDELSEVMVHFHTIVGVELKKHEEMNSVGCIIAQ